MIKKRLNGCAIFIIVLMVAATHSSKAQDHSLAEIQQSFKMGVLDVNEAALQQLSLFSDSALNKQFIKCATPVFAFLHEHNDDISPDILRQFDELKQSSAALKSSINIYISNTGKFEIHYQTTGNHSVPLQDNNANGVPDYVEWIGEAADSSYRHQVINIGFKDPIPNAYRYKISVRDLPNIYGFAQVESGAGAQTSIVIENDFIGFPANTHPEGHQKGAIKATMAHEFKHAIQYSQLNDWPIGGWAEMDATLMEEVVYDNVNDYYNYIKVNLASETPHPSSVFGASSRSIPGTGYNTVTWMIYYYERLGIGLWKDVWDIMAGQSIRDIAEALHLVQPKTDFNSHFIKSHLWHYASGSRAAENDYGFGEKQFYPQAATEDDLAQVPDHPIGIPSISKLAARYIEVIPGNSDAGLIDMAIDIDSDISNAGIGALFYLKSGETAEYIRFGENKDQLYLPSEVLWEDVERVGIVIANNSQTETLANLLLQIGKNGNRFEIKDPEYLIESVELSQNYPNPFNPQTRIDFILPSPAFVKLEVFDILGRRINLLVKDNLNLGPHSKIFDASGLSSGLYLYRLQVGDKVFVKKMILTN